MFGRLLIRAPGRAADDGGACGVQQQSGRPPQRLECVAHPFPSTQPSEDLKIGERDKSREPGAYEPPMAAGARRGRHGAPEEKRPPRPGAAEGGPWPDHVDGGGQRGRGRGGPGRPASRQLMGADAVAGFDWGAEPYGGREGESKSHGGGPHGPEADLASPPRRGAERRERGEPQGVPTPAARPPPLPAGAGAGDEGMRALRSWVEQRFRDEAAARRRLEDDVRAAQGRAVAAEAAASDAAAAARRAVASAAAAEDRISSALAARAAAASAGAATPRGPDDGAVAARAMAAAGAAERAAEAAEAAARRASEASRQHKGEEGSAAASLDALRREVDGARRAADEAVAEAGRARREAGEASAGSERAGVAAEAASRTAQTAADAVRAESGAAIESVKRASIAAAEEAGRQVRGAVAELDREVQALQARAAAVRRRPRARWEACPGGRPAGVVGPAATARSVCAATHRFAPPPSLPDAPDAFPRLLSTRRRKGSAVMTGRRPSAPSTACTRLPGTPRRGCARR